MKITPLPIKKERKSKVVCSIRLTTEIKMKLIKKHGSLQHAIDYMVSKDNLK